MKEFYRPEIIWCVLGVIMLFAEFFHPACVVLFFGFGALVVALICAFTGININTQIIIFLVVSLVSLFILRRWVKSIFKGYLGREEKMEKNIDSYKGEMAKVVETIRAGAIGRIEFHGTLWNAIASEDIPEGSMVIIEEQNNLTFKVKLYKNKE